MIHKLATRTGDSFRANEIRRNIEVHMLTRYSEEAASSRYRMYQAVPRFVQGGLKCRIQPFLYKGYAESVSDSSKRSYKRILLGYMRRVSWLRTASRPDVFYIQMDAFPFLPAYIERCLMPRGVPFVLDYDDAWFHRYQDHPLLAVRYFVGHKIPQLMKTARSIVAGSAYIAEFASQYNRSVHKVPTCIDLSRYPTSQPSVNPKSTFIIGWIGSPGTAPFLREVEDALASFCRMYPAKVVVIGAGDVSLSIPNIVRLNWSSETEVQEVSNFDVGIMPLPDTPFTRGKCAFKLIQYMGCWKPVIASPVGENCHVVENGKNGFLAKNAHEWIEALRTLYLNRELRSEMGMAGRARVEKSYNLDVVAPKLIEILVEATLGKGGE